VYSVRDTVWWKDETALALKDTVFLAPRHAQHCCSSSSFRLDAAVDHNAEAGSSELLEDDVQLDTTDGVLVFSSKRPDEAIVVFLLRNFDKVDFVFFFVGRGVECVALSLVRAAVLLVKIRKSLTIVSHCRAVRNWHIVLCLKLFIKFVVVFL
jgi:hypothetical protein